MRILALIHTLSHPPQSGVTKRTFHLLDGMVQHHEVTVLAMGTAVEQSSIRAYFGTSLKSVTFIDTRAPRWINLLKRVRMALLGKSLLQISVTQRFQKALDEILISGPYDLLFLSTPVFLYYDLPEGIPCITDTHNVEYDLFYRAYLQARNIFTRAYFYYQYRLLRRDEVMVCGTADVLLTTSERDRNIFRRELPAQTIHVIPNGVDLGYFAPENARPIPHSMVFCGVMNYLPNIQGITYFLDEIFPRIRALVPDATVTIVGSHPPPALLRRSSSDVEVTGHVEDIRPYVARAAVYIIPLTIGGGTRLKALEAAAMKKPIVSTSLGCEGINFIHGESALFADTAVLFAESVVRVFEDPGLGDRLGGRAAEVAAAYGWNAIGDNLNRLFLSITPEAPEQSVSTPPVTMGNSIAG